jgi:uncharacterized protein (TIGR02246 family)
MSKPSSQNDADAIQKASRQFAIAAETADADLWASLYTDDAVMLPPHSPVVQGKAAIAQYMNESFFGLFDIAMSDTTDALVVDGDLAFRRGTVHLNLRPKNGDPSFDDVVRYIEIWQRQSDGAWKLTEDMFNSSLESE